MLTHSPAINNKTVVQHLPNSVDGFIETDEEVHGCWSGTAV